MEVEISGRGPNDSSVIVIDKEFTGMVHLESEDNELVILRVYLNKADKGTQKILAALNNVTKGER